MIDPRILILDDATSSVDAETEFKIRRALVEVMRDRTTFIIAHRPSTIALAEEIVVLDQGRIVERGTHDELIAGDTLYARMFGDAEADGTTLDVVEVDEPDHGQRQDGRRGSLWVDLPAQPRRGGTAGQMAAAATALTAPAPTSTSPGLARAPASRRASSSSRGSRASSRPTGVAPRSVSWR